MRLLMICPSWRRKVSIVLFLQTTLNWSTKMFVLNRSIVVRSYDLSKSKSYDSIHGWLSWMWSVFTDDRIAAELFHKHHELWTMMLSSNEITVCSDMPMLSFFNYRKSLLIQSKGWKQYFSGGVKSKKLWFISRWKYFSKFCELQNFF